jgi:SAM-dependent methyltransferase
MGALALCSVSKKTAFQKLTSVLNNDGTIAPAARAPRSYTSGRLTTRQKVREAYALYGRYLKRSEETCDAVVSEFEAARQTIEALRRVPLKGMAVLDVGPGPFLAYSNCFAVENTVTAIDSDIIPIGLSPLSYIRMLRYNGTWRTAKTIGRKILGIDRAQQRTLRKKIGRRVSRVRVLHGDVCDTRLPGDSFDVIYCRSVMQHIMAPERALTEMARILRQDGVLYVSLHLYTSHNGAHPFHPEGSAQPDEMFWSHLRPGVDNGLGTSACLNGLRLDDWKLVFQSRCPGHSLEIRESTDPRVRHLAEKYLASGELAGYRIEELMAHELIFVWKKSS